MQELKSNLSDSSERNSYSDDQIFSKINSSPFSYNSKSYHIVGAQIKYNSNINTKLMEQVTKEDYVINLTLRIINASGFNLYNIDTETGGSNFYNHKQGMDMHLDIYTYLRNLESMNGEQIKKYKETTLKVLKKEYKDENFKLNNLYEDKSLNFFLINLMLNSEIFLIRNYLNLKIDNKFIIQNDMIFHSAYTIFYKLFVADGISSNLNTLLNTLNNEGKFKDNSENITNSMRITLFDFFKNKKVLKHLETVLAIMRIVLARIINPQYKPFETQLELIKENFESGGVLIMEVKKMISIVKVMKCYEKID